MYQYFSVMGDQPMFDLFFTQQKNRQSTKIQEKRPQKSKRQLKLCHKTNYAFIIFSSQY